MITLPATEAIAKTSFSQCSVFDGTVICYCQDVIQQTSVWRNYHLLNPLNLSDHLQSGQSLANQWDIFFFFPLIYERLQGKQHYFPRQWSQNYESPCICIPWASINPMHMHSSEMQQKVVPNFSRDNSNPYLPLRCSGWIFSAFPASGSVKTRNILTPLEPLNR